MKLMLEKTSSLGCHHCYDSGFRTERDGSIDNKLKIHLLHGMKREEKDGAGLGRLYVVGEEEEVVQ